MANDTVITVIGNLTDDPELRFTPNGAAVAKFRIASTPRHFDKNTNEWVDDEPMFLPVSVWRQPAENVAESLKRGTRVVVVGRLVQRSYETKEGEKRTVYELQADEVAPSLRYATATLSKSSGVSPGSGSGNAARAGAGSGRANQSNGRQGAPARSNSNSAPVSDPWADEAPF